MKILNKIPPKKRGNIKHDFFVFDTETNGFNARPEAFIFGCLYGHNFTKFFYSVEEFKTEIFSGKYKKKYIFCHNSHYDLPVIFDNIFINLDHGAIFNGSRFILAQRDGVLFADSFNILNASVENVGKALGLHKQKISDKFMEGTHKGAAFVTGAEREYCKIDCVIVYNALLTMFETVGSIRPTIASLALLFYRRKYQPYHIAYNENLTPEFFDAYYGGRVECFKLGKTNARKYDVNSMYPYVMKHGKFPNVKTLHNENVLTLRRLKVLLKNKEGMATITVKHKGGKFGFLPVKKEGRLIFPVGTFTGSWCFPEIRYALENKIISILEVKKIIYASPVKSPFDTFITDLYEARKRETGYLKTVYKFLMNNLYGKFGQREKYKNYYLPYFSIDLDQQLQATGKYYEFKFFNTQRNDCYLTVSNEIPLKIQMNETFTNYEFEFQSEKKAILKAEKLKIHCIPVFSAYITSMARVHLLKAFIKYDKNFTIVYSDTDSIAVEKQIPLRNSNELGKFKKENEIITEIFGNKSYIEFDGLKYSEKIKGIPKKAIKLAHGKYTDKKLIKLKQAIRQNKKVGSTEIYNKELSFKYDKRKVHTGGETEPIEI